MKREDDLRGLLRRWAYDPEHNVRIIQGADGREILQVRLPVGIEQYEVDGRPDGNRPGGKESIFEVHLARLARARVAGAERDFVLSAEQCVELFGEGTLYYARYVHLFQAGDWQRTVRDTARNLKLFDFVHRYAERAEDREYLEKWRPYIVRMHAIASVMVELSRSQHARALKIVRGAVRRIEALPETEDETFQIERDRSLAALRALAEQVDQVRPLTERERLERLLRRAIAGQEFERAAQLRDRIRALGQVSGAAGPGGAGRNSADNPREEETTDGR